LTGVARNLAAADTQLRDAKKAHALAKAKGMGTTGSALAQWDAEGSLTLAPFYGQEEQAKVRGAKVTATISHGTTHHVQGHTLTLNARFLLDALDTFTGDTVTLHLQAADDGQFVKAVLLTDGDAITGDRYRHLLQPVRLNR
jgi:DNA polymerase-3 subunit beta